MKTTNTANPFGASYIQKKRRNYCFLAFSSLCFFSSAVQALSLEALSEDALRDVDAQALFSLSYLAPTDKTNFAIDVDGSKNIGFYRFGMEADIEVNTNIKTLQLGCGGVNGADGCDIDIRNLSLSGLNKDIVQNGTNAGSPIFNEGRTSTSALLTNPFIEFAIKNPQNAALREMVGFRLSAEAIEGLLSAGLDNLSTPSTTDGIQSLSGYLQVAATTGDVKIKQATFGKAGGNCNPGAPNCQSIGGTVKTILGHRNFKSLPSDSGTTGITVPSLNVDFNLPTFTINGNRQTQAVAENVTAKIPWLPIAAPGGCPQGVYNAACNSANSQISGVNFSNDKLRVLLTKFGNTQNWPGECLSVFLIGCVVRNSNFAMADGSALTDLNIDITFEQSLSMFHNIPLRGTGGYLSLQGQSLHWPGAKTDDVAQKGWWLSFAEPVQLGHLQSSNDVDISAVLPQVAEFATNALLTGPSIDVSGLGDSWTALTNGVLRKQLLIDLSNSPSAKLTLANEQLRSQQVVSNCWGTLKFC